MTLLAVERIKLFSTRSPWWCTLLALLLPIGISALATANTGTDFPASVTVTQYGMNFALMVVMVMAALAVTTEYRFGTIRSTFQAVPGRVSALVAKAAVVGLVAGVVGEAAAFAAWGIGKLIKPDDDLAINTAQSWREVAGAGLVFVFAAMLALGVGLLVRQTAAAVAILLVYALLLENLVSLIPNIGSKIQRWMPFQMADNFRTDGALQVTGRGKTSELHGVIGPWWSLAYFAGIALVILIVAIATAQRRDA